jgi:hypothetical protein
LTLAKCQAQMAMDKASKACGLTKKILSTMKNVTPMSSVLSNLSARCYDVRFLMTSPFSFGFIAAL